MKRNIILAIKEVGLCDSKTLEAALGDEKAYEKIIIQTTRNNSGKIG